MKRSLLDKKKHNLMVLEKKLQAYAKVREVINSLAAELKDDPYALEALIGIDRSIFNQMRFMQLGHMRLKQEVVELEKQQQQ